MINILRLPSIVDKFEHLVNQRKEESFIILFCRGLYFYESFSAALSFQSKEVCYVVYVRPSSLLLLILPLRVGILNKIRYVGVGEI
jgi:hypothetical protein